MPRQPKPPAPPKPWQRAEAGRYRSSDERFTLESDGSGRWFVTDEAERDDLGLARTTGPFATLDAAKAAADEARGRPAAASPLAARLAEAAARPKAPSGGAAGRVTHGGSATAEEAGEPKTHRGPATAGEAGEPTRAPEPAPPPRTWLDDVADRDPAAATRARRLIGALEREGIADADALVRRDLLGDRPAVAARLLARDIVAALGGLGNPTAAQVAEAIVGIVASSPKRGPLPGWELLERDGPRPDDRGRSIRVTADDLRSAATPGGDLHGDPGTDPARG